MNEIESLFETGVYNLVIGLAPKGACKFFASASQAMSTGDAGNQAKIEHQAIGDSVSECVEKVNRRAREAKKALHAEPSIVKVRSN